MTRTAHNRIADHGRTGLMMSALVGSMLALAATDTHAQQPVGVPFIGSNHLSVSVTELSRDGIGSQRATVLGALYGHRFGGSAAKVQPSMIVRVAARPLDGVEQGILDAGVTLAATRELVRGLNVTAAAGVSAVAWGDGAPEPNEPATGRIIVRAPLSAGLAYDIGIGGATIAPFVNVAMAYSTEREYAGDVRLATDNGWKLGNAAGVSVRFRETVLSISGISRERGLPNSSRVAFSAGMSW
jgi:hypothetical protein